MRTEHMAYRRECALRESEAAHQAERDLAGAVERTEAVLVKLRAELADTRQRRAAMRRTVEEVNYQLRGNN